MTVEVNSNGDVEPMEVTLVIRTDDHTDEITLSEHEARTLLLHLIDALER
jgi:hypothetical protein